MTLVYKSLQPTDSSRHNDLVSVPRIRTHMVSKWYFAIKSCKSVMLCHGNLGPILFNHGMFIGNPLNQIVRHVSQTGPQKYILVKLRAWNSYLISLNSNLAVDELLGWVWSKSGLIQDSRPTNERRCYFVTTSLIGWMHTYNQPCKYIQLPCL